jgi:hypothetical protein
MQYGRIPIGEKAPVVADCRQPTGSMRLSENLETGCQFPCVIAHAVAISVANCLVAVAPHRALERKGRKQSVQQHVFTW